jgi:hypothetical protein
MIEVLPEPRAEPESDSENDSESDSDSDSDSDSHSEVDSRVKDDIHGKDDETIPRDATVEPETFELAPSSPQPQQQPQHVRKPAPVPFDPGSYVSAQYESQSHASHVYKADMTMWNESTRQARIYAPNRVQT